MVHEFRGTFIHVRRRTRGMSWRVVVCDVMLLLCCCVGVQFSGVRVQLAHARVSSTDRVEFDVNVVHDFVRRFSAVVAAV